MAPIGFNQIFSALHNELLSICVFVSMFRKTALLLLLCGVFQHIQAQNQHDPLYDVSKKVHFGFGVGLNTSAVALKFSEHSYTQNQFTKVSQAIYPFVSLQPVCNIHLRERLDLRLVLDFSLSQRNIDFTHITGFKESKVIPSTYLGIPVLLKYKSVRHENWRLYAIGGFGYAYDFDSNEGAVQNISEPLVALRKHNYYYSFGLGFDIYNRLYKLSPELRLANGLNNALVPNTDAYTAMFSGAQKRMIWLSFFFE